MTEKIRFHLDENVEGVIAEELRKREIDVTTTPEVGLIGSSDTEQLAFIIGQNCVIFTHDADFLRVHQQATEHTGIIYSRQGRRSVGEILRSLVRIYDTQTPESMANHIEFI